MSYDTAVGFWSYAHEDDKLDNGAILALAQAIMEEYNLLSGEPLKLFVDHNEIAWGDEWRARINSSLAQTTFFIPIITPRYFTRSECRRELLEFAAKSKSLGVGELLLPIVYVEMQDLSPESPDEAMALVARTQYVDWHTNRLVETGSREYKVAVNALARRLLDIARSAAETQLANEVGADPEDDGIDGLTDIIEKIENLLPEWLEAVYAEKTNSAQVEATWNQYLTQINKLRRGRAAASAILSTQIRLAKEILPLVERGQKDARIYLTRSTELDPMVSELIRLLDEHPASLPLIMPVKDALDEAIVEIRIEEQNERDPGRTNIRKELHEMRHLGRLFQKCVAVLSNMEQEVRAGNEIVRRWDSELSAVLSRTAEAPDQSTQSAGDNP